MQNGRTLVPLRAIFEAKGATVSWDQKTQTVTAVNGTVTMIIKVGDKKITKNGTQISLDAPPQIVNGRTLVQLVQLLKASAQTLNWRAVHKQLSSHSRM